MSVDKCKLVNIRSIYDPRGSLSFIEGGVDAPFNFERLYYLYNVPKNSERGAHAHKGLQQLIFCVHGSVTISLYDGFQNREILLDRPDIGLYVCPMIWRDLHEFEGDAVLMVLASEKYNESDYIRKIEDFELAIRS